MWGWINQSQEPRIQFKSPTWITGTPSTLTITDAAQGALQLELDIKPGLEPSITIWNASFQIVSSYCLKHPVLAMCILKYIPEAISQHITYS